MEWLFFTIIKSYLSSTKNLEFNSGGFSTEIRHLSDTLFLEYLQLGRTPALSTSGFRELTIDLIECQSGCQSCVLTNLASCNTWISIDYKMRSKNLQNFKNDGWKRLGDKPYNLFTIYFFGFFDKITKLEKTVFLQPHYAIQVQFHIIYINFNQQTKPTTSILFDDVTVHQVVELLDVLQLMLCNYLSQDYLYPAKGDQVNRVNFQRLHNQSKLKITITQQQASDTNTPWGLRDFKILLKKCHSSCLYSCTGPQITDCVGVKKYYDTICQLFE